MSERPKSSYSTIFQTFSSIFSLIVAVIVAGATISNWKTEQGSRELSIRPSLRFYYGEYGRLNLTNFGLGPAYINYVKVSIPGKSEVTIAVSDQIGLESALKIQEYSLDLAARVASQFTLDKKFKNAPAISMSRSNIVMPGTVIRSGESFNVFNIENAVQIVLFASNNMSQAEYRDFRLSLARKDFLNIAVGYCSMSQKFCEEVSL